MGHDHPDLVAAVTSLRDYASQLKEVIMGYIAATRVPKGDQFMFDLSVLGTVLELLLRSVNDTDSEIEKPDQIPVLSSVIENFAVALQGLRENLAITHGDEGQAPRSQQSLRWPLDDFESQEANRKLRRCVTTCLLSMFITLGAILRVGSQSEDAYARDDNPLYAAALDGDETAVRLCSGIGANMNVHGGLYGNALQAASVNGHEAIVRLLLDLGSEVNAAGGHYATALNGAATRGHGPVVQLLLENGADVNAKVGRFGNALCSAVARGHVEIVESLLAHKADVNAKVGNYSGGIPLSLDEMDDADIPVMLMTDPDYNSHTALYLAAAYGDEAMIELLVDAGADVNGRCGFFGNVLQAATAGGHEGAAKLLVERGADVHAIGGFYGTAIAAAYNNGHQSLAKFMESIMKEDPESKNNT